MEGNIWLRQLADMRNAPVRGRRTEDAILGDVLGCIYKQIIK